MNKLPTLLITGANGYTGSHACDYFSKKGFNVVGVTRNSHFNGEVQREICDLTNKNSVIKLIQKIKPDFLLHLAGKNHVGDSWRAPSSFLETNVMSTIYLLEALRQENVVCKILIAGSALQFNPTDLSTLNHPYSLSKTFQSIAAQSWVALYDMDIIIAKPSNLIGPGPSNGVCSIFAKKIVEMENENAEKFLMVNNLGAQRDFLDVRDVVKAYEVLLRKGNPGEVYDIASGQSHSLREIITTMKTFTCQNFEVKSESAAQPEEKFQIPPLKMIELGWTPSFSLSVSLKDTLTYYRQNKNT
ncbi:NAD-dependent epimerase/dehydratase family protein [Priestia aryabhattai]|uniref:NAD-dependent epimerase/dehydratase family protein n=1 Tax=Priestia aryabhattai TaxID=412384 RepID=UPI002E218708|nr:NAD-dependent epimerase/dehydratase family protein [Priestia aryabhattai]MED4003642.1 NAD-dependent epimerase/dehydratase family protein [Priestia aryabhattai]